MLKVNYLKRISTLFLFLLSTFLGLQIINAFLKYNDKPAGQYHSSYRKYKKLGQTVYFSHHQTFDVASEGENTIILVGDSFGAGSQCGNQKNLAGCLKDETGKKVINLSKDGATPAFYLKNLDNYLLGESKRIDSKSGGETVYFILYSNDTIIDLDYCKFYREKIEKKNLLSGSDSIYIDNLCHKIESRSNLERVRSHNKLLFKGSNFVIPIFGKYNFLIAREVAARLNSSLSINKNLGRAAYFSQWTKDTPNRNLLIEVIKESKNICKKYNCNIKFAIYPNMENLKADSIVYKGYNNFIDYLWEKNKIRLYNGYIPFQKERIQHAVYSLTDTHPNCEAHKLFSKWLITIE